MKEKSDAYEIMKIDAEKLHKLEENHKTLVQSLRSEIDTKKFKINNLEEATDCLEKEVEKYKRTIDELSSQNKSLKSSLEKTESTLEIFRAQIESYKKGSNS